MEATRGQRTHCPRSLHLNIGQLSIRELSFYANSDFCVMRSVVSQSGDGEMVSTGEVIAAADGGWPLVGMQSI